MQKIKAILFSILLSLLSLSVFALYQTFEFNDHKLHVVFCNVGQGDGILIRTPSGVNIINDGGPGDSILECLSRHMPLWDRSIAAMILTHPHADHINGLISTIQRYTVRHFYTENLFNNTAGFAVLKENLTKENVQLIDAYAGDDLKIADGVVFRFLGPTKEFLALTSPNGKIGESGEFGSLITEVEYGKLRILLTGDSQADEMMDAATHLSSSINILQVPHHGSKTGLNSQILSMLSPKLVVISVGKNNKYGHPAKETLNLLQTSGLQILRTDLNGEVEIVSDGQKWSVK